RRPFTILVLVIAVVLGAGLATQRMPRDIFPTLGIPTIYVAQPYGGMDPAQMEGYLTYYYEYHFLYITGIEHVESKSIQGAAIMKLQFYPGTDMNQAMAETVGYVNRARSFMPPGTVPPFITRFDAGSVPVGDLVFTSETATVAQMQDAALNRVRPLFATLPGVSAPPPFGGSARTILINVDPERLRSYNMSPDEIVGALTRANLISPSGNMAVAGKYPMVPLNSVVQNIKDLESVPIRVGTYPTVFVRDVGQVVDGSDIVTSYALIDGRRTVYVPVTKRADASTLTVVELVKENLAKFQAVVPEGVKVSYEFDQSPYVTRAIDGLVFEGALGALLTGVMVLLFLRDWRSALIVVINIPLALTGAVLGLWLTGETVNIMTLGGLALAIGVLVDMSTVVLENVHTHLALGKRVARAVVDSGREVALPLLISMLCVLAVFVPSFFMVGAARAMFLPLSLAVGFAMVGSYLLSSTLVPIVSVWLLRGHEHAAAGAPQTEGAFARFQRRYAELAARVVSARWLVVGVYAAAAALVIVLVGRGLGTEIFPKVDTGQLQVRLRAPTGTRVDGTEQIALEALDVIKNEVGPDNVRITLAFLGVHAPNYPINLIYLWNGGSEEGVLQVQLKSGTGIRTEALKERLRERFAEQLPGVGFSFEPSDIVSQVMSLGSSTPIEVAVSGPSLDANRAFATRVLDRLAKIPSLRDVQFGQALDYPTLDVKVDRERAGLMGVEMAEVSRSLVAATSSSRFVVPNYWADPNSGIAYQIQVQIPQAAMNSVEALENLPVAYENGQPVLLRSLASVTPGTAPGQYERYNMQRMITVTANLEGDLGTVSGEVRSALAELGDPPARMSVALRGQVVPLEQMLDGLETGLALAVVVIFLLLAANFQSLKLAFIVVSTTPAALAGVLLALKLTGTTMNIQSFMGAIMAVGVAVANAILLVTFAERSRIGGAESGAAAIEGAASRLRPISMTSAAMIAGMLPLAIGFGEGGEQTAPLGRAVVGGLAAATLATLLVLPAVFAIVQSRAHRRSASLDPDDAERAATR
ncbi:MAG TPA: efflux RND transporter permease subunit, partial [Gammaproteobacteria bacterium]|nr:efflux RND transporter permease subunit [Gammaproteobacteria bacterium]